MNVVAVVGPTASGKSAVAEALARFYGADILSVDSMQVYRGMDIGTAKPSAAIRSEISHHMIDLVAASEELSVAQFQTIGRDALGGRDRVVIVGGSGMHFRAIVDPLEFAPTDPDVRANIEATPIEQLQHELLAIDHRAPDVLDIHNPRRVIRAIEVWRISGLTPTERETSPQAVDVRSYRPNIEHVSIGMDAGDDTLDRIRNRLSSMIEAGFVEEVAALESTMSRTARQAVGYKELIAAISSETSLSESIADIERSTAALARRQRTYFRRDPRIHWMHWLKDEVDRVKAAIEYVGKVAGWTL